MIKKKIIIITIALLLAIYTIFKISNFIKIDKCLDSGGKWNYELENCEH